METYRKPTKMVLNSNKNKITKRNRLTLSHQINKILIIKHAFKISLRAQKYWMRQITYQSWAQRETCQKLFKSSSISRTSWFILVWEGEVLVRYFWLSSKIAQDFSHWKLWTKIFCLETNYSTTHTLSEPFYLILIILL